MEGGKGGLKSFEASLEGFWASDTADAVDPEIFPRLGISDEVATLSPPGTEGSACYLCQASKLAYSLFGEIGQLIPFTLGLGGSNTVGAVRGRLAAAKQTVDATGVLGSVVELGAVAADEFLYAAVHVFAAGTDITLIVESDDDPGFASATTQATIGPLTATGGTWMTRVAGPLTDTQWRVSVDDIDGEFEIAVALAVGPYACPNPFRPSRVRWPFLMELPVADETLVDCRIEVNSVVYSTTANKATSDFEAEVQDNTAFGGSGWKAGLAGLKSGTIGIDFFNDYADNALDESLWALFGTNVTVKIRKSSGSISATNPEYSGSVTINQVIPFSVGVGEISKQSLSWPTTGAWARAAA